jgi:hypothetical protein
VALFAALLCTASASGASATPAASITPQPRVHAAIESAANSRNEEELAERMRALVAVSGPEYRDLVPQLVLYSLEQRDARHAMVPAVLRERLAITDAQLVAALLPYLSTPDDRQRKQMYDWLTAVDGVEGSKGESHDFSLYQSIIASRRADPPLGLVRYMYETDSPRAATVLAEVYLEPEQREKLLAARRPVDDARATHRAGRPLDAGQTVVAREALKTLSRDPNWWVRLYAAAVLAQVRELRTPELIAVIHADSNPLVRAFAAQ